jgi:hypothetical protein
MSSISRENFSTPEIKNVMANKEPDCMKAAASVTPGRENLSENEAEKAVASLINTEILKLEFPKTRKMRLDPPLARQNFYTYYFVPSKGAKPDDDGCFGLMKIRGCFPSSEEATEYCEMLVRQYDSIHENMIGYVGQEFPLTIDSKYCLTTKEVDIRSKVDKINKDELLTVRENEKREKEEIIERQRALLEDVSKEQTFEDIDYYIQLRTKVAQSRILQEECEKKSKEASKIIKKAKSEIDELDEKFPNYKKEYEERYKSAMSSIGAEGAAALNRDRMLKYMK